jgi:hypothetical protein
MSALVRKVVFGLLATTLAIGTAQVALAKPWPKPWPWPHYYHGPIVVNPIVRYVANPVPADIQLANPNQVDLKYTLNGGPVQVLPAGGAIAIHENVIIAFDRGGAQGWMRNTLTSGAYQFVPANGAWAIVRQVPDSSVATNPLPPTP